MITLLILGPAGAAALHRGGISAPPQLNPAGHNYKLSKSSSALDLTNL